MALQKAQATAVYAGLKLWPVSVTAALVRAQLIEDGGYPNAAAILAEAAGAANDDPASTDPEWVQSGVGDYSPDQPRDLQGRWTNGGGSAASTATPGGTQSRYKALVLPPTNVAASTGIDPHAPDGSAIAQASLHGKGRGRGLVAVLRALAQLGRRWSRYRETKGSKAQKNSSPSHVESKQKTSDPKTRSAPETDPTSTGQPSQLHEGQQDKHIPGTNNYKAGKSILDHSDPQSLLDAYAGTTRSVNKTPFGEPGSKERIDFGEPIGRVYNKETGEYVPTTEGMIHYVRRGAHIVPIGP